MRITSLRFKVLALVAVVALASAGVVALVAYVGGRDSLEKAAYEQLTVVRETKADHAEDYFWQTRNHLLTLSEDQMISDALRDLGSWYSSIAPPEDPEVQALHDAELQRYYEREFVPRLSGTTLHEHSVDEFLPDDPIARELQYQFIVENPNPTGSKQLYDGPEEGAGYARVHAEYQPLMRSILDRFGYYDMFLIDAEDGDIVYSVFKEVDFGTSLEDGPYQDTNLAKAFRAARDSGNPSLVVHEDFSPYEPSYDAPASFMASPIPGPDGEIQGVLAFQVPIDRINEIMTSGGDWQKVGLGDSGETYLVADDLTMRSESRFLLEDKAGYLAAVAASGLPQETVATIDRLDSSIGLQVVETPGAVAAQLGQTGTDIFEDYREVPVLSAYRPLRIPDVDWVIMSEIDEEEAFRSVNEFGMRALVALLIVAVVITIVAIWFSSRLVRPINELSASATAIAGGDLDVVIDTGGSDEIGDLARAFADMQSAISDQIASQERQIEALTTPLIPLRDDVVVLPLVGELERKRSEKLGQGLVTGVFERSARVAIIDMTGTHATANLESDEESLQILTRAFQAVRLLGVSVVITGMRADLATRFTECDLDMTGVATEPTLQMGIDRAARVRTDGK